MKKRVRKQMYAVSLDGVGLIAGTLAYSRRAAILHFQNGGVLSEIAVREWERCKNAGYRTVKATVEYIWIDGDRW